MKKALSLIIIAAILAAAALYFLLVWQSSISQFNTNKEPEFSSADVDRGRVLAGLGNCASCHTVDETKPYAGGVPFTTPFGTLYSSNITPDTEKGIGRWPLSAFTRALREGVSRDGSHLFPAFPYTHYKNLSDNDIQALYAFVMSLEPIAQDAPENALSFPFNLRFLQAGWKLLFFDKDERWQAVANQSESYNRGAYLAKGLGHCSACHTPRNSFGAEDAARSYDGALVNNWYAPALNDTQTVPVRWNEALLYDYLRTGQSDIQGVAAGSMGEVVHQGLALASDSDIRALSVYTNSLSDDESSAPDASAATAKRLITAANQRETTGDEHGEHLYRVSCASCHYNTPDMPKALRAELSLNSAVTADNPSNLLRITLEGVAADAGTPGIVMPAFNHLSDADVIALAQFLRYRADQPQWLGLQERVQELRQ